MMGSRLRTLTALLTVLGITLAGCGETNADQDSVEEAADSQVVEVVLRDYEFVGLPHTVASGTQFTVVSYNRKPIGGSIQGSNRVGSGIAFLGKN